jgi:hypothetical protein
MNGAGLIIRHWINAICSFFAVDCTVFERGVLRKDMSHAFCRRVT